MLASARRERERERERESERRRERGRGPKGRRPRLIERKKTNERSARQKGTTGRNYLTAKSIAIT